MFINQIIAIIKASQFPSNGVFSMITVEWDDATDKRLLCTTFKKPWNWQEWDAAAKIIAEQMTAVEYPIIMLQDIQEAGFPPNGGVWRFRQIINTMDEKVERVLFLGMSGFVKNVIETLRALNFGRVQMDRFNFISTKEEARALLPPLPNAAKTQKQISPPSSVSV